MSVTLVCLKAVKTLRWEKEGDMNLLGCLQNTKMQPTETSFFQKEAAVLYTETFPYLTTTADLMSAAPQFRLSSAEKELPFFFGISVHLF